MDNDLTGHRQVVVRNWQGYMNNYWNNEEYNRAHGSNADGPRMASEEPRERTPAERLARTAMFMGIFAIAMLFFSPVIVPGVLASMSIVLAILSRGREQRMPGESKRALAFGVVSLAAYITFMGIVGTTMYLMVTDPDVRERGNELMTQFYGYSLDDLLRSIDESYGTQLEVMPEEDI